MTTQIAIAAAGALVAILAVLGLYLRFKRRGPEVARALEAVAIDRLHDVLVPDGMGGQIHAEHLLLTGAGIVVLEVKEYQGTIFGSDRMEEWTVIGSAGRRFTFPNPLEALYDRVAALKQLVREIPVEGYVLFSGGASFSKGRPRSVLLPAELVAQHRLPHERAELEQVKESFAPSWELVKSACEPVRGAARR